jgi:ribosome-associated translation inhibitor RaiA
MQIQVNTDNHIEGNADLIAHVESTLEHALTRFRQRITRVEVQLSDENGSKRAGPTEMRCVLEARLAGLKPVKVDADSATVEQALDAAAKKLFKLLERTLDRLDDPKGRTSFAGEQS